MKYFLLAGFLTLSARAALAQTLPPSAATPASRYQHCTLDESGNSWHLDYGQNGKPALQDAELAKDYAAIAQMRSGVLALNYLSNRGWEVMGVTSSSGSTYSGRVSYLLRRPLP